MRTKLGCFLPLVLLVGVAFSQVFPERFLPALSRGRVGTSGTSIQEFPLQKPKYDYMSSFYSRNTKPLGLKEDVALRKLMRQRGFKWAVRAGLGHILN
ncbi:MAG: hypothetical protein ACUVV5_05465 [Candidatus Aminicenantales bacterium]